MEPLKHIIQAENLSARNQEILFLLENHSGKMDPELVQILQKRKNANKRRLTQSRQFAIESLKQK